VSNDVFERKAEEARLARSRALALLPSGLLRDPARPRRRALEGISPRRRSFPGRRRFLPELRPIRFRALPVVRASRRRRPRSRLALRPETSKPQSTPLESAIGSDQGIWKAGSA